MNPLTSLTQDGLSIIKRSPGLTLVLIGFAAIYLIAIFSSQKNISIQIVYLTFAFSFIVALAGIVLMFHEMRKESLMLGSASSVANASDLEMAVTQLGKNYDILRQQATQGFILAAIFMALGVIVEAVSGIGMYLFNRTFQQLNTTSDRLHELWKLLAAFKRAEVLPENDRGTVIIGLINKLVESPVPARIN